MEGYSKPVQTASYEKKPRRVESYETSDGKLFHTLQDANIHHLKLTFEEWYAKNPMIFDNIDGRTMGLDAATVYHWIEENVSGLLPLVRAVFFEILGEE